MYLKKIIQKEGILFMIKVEVNKETRKACEDATKGVNLSKTYDSFDDVMKDINTGKDTFKN